MLTAILTVVLFCIMIIPHEFGHFITAKLCGVQVNEFSMGMGPALYQKQRGETLYSVRAVPIGGYCAMEGENEESGNPRAFNNKNGAQKILILAAGAIMNILVAILIMIILVTMIGVATTTLDKVTKNSPAASAGLKAGDRITAVNGKDTDDWSEVVSGISVVKKGESMTVTVLRNGSDQTFKVTPEYSSKEKRMTVGIQCRVSHNIFPCAKQGVIATWNLNKMMLKSFKMLFTGKLTRNDVSGPVGMVSLVNQSAHYGAVSFLYLAALICLNLAVINLLPFPALDGGRILFVIIRKVTGSMITDEIEGRVHLIGMSLLMAFFVLITWNDIARLIH